MSFFAQSRERIADLPTPLQFAPEVTEALGGPRVYIKRDDLTGLALGGNKTRKLEYLLADAKSRGATHLITIGAVQSNHACQTAAAARLAGMQAELILETKVPEPELQGNLLLDVLLGARYHLIESMAESDEAVERVSAQIRASGGVPYVIPVGGSNGVGSLGYVSAMLELSYQLWSEDISPVAVYFGSGSGGTHAGIQLGAKMFGINADMRGVMVSPNMEAKREKIVSVAEAAAALIGIANPVSADELTLVDGYVGAGYGATTQEGLEAIALLARTEGILLDPVYTAKAFSGMAAEIRAGRYATTDSVVFIHTGGSPALFASVDELRPILGT